MLRTECSQTLCIGTATLQTLQKSLAISGCGQEDDSENMIRHAVVSKRLAFRAPSVFRVALGSLSEVCTKKTRISVHGHPASRLPGILFDLRPPGGLPENSN